MSRICGKWFLELHCFNVDDRYLQFIVSDIYKFYNNKCPDYFHEVLCPVDDNGVAMHFCNKQLKLPFRKFKLEMQSLSYVGPSISKHRNNRKSNVSNLNTIFCTSRYTLFTLMSKFPCI